MTKFSSFGGSNLKGGQKFLQNNEIVAKFAFLLVVIFVFVVLLKAGTRLLAYIFTPSSDPILLNGMKDGTNYSMIPVDPNQSGAIPILRSTDQYDGLVFTWSTWIFLKQPDIPNHGCAPGACPDERTRFNHIFSKGSSTQGPNGIMQPNNAPGLYVSNDYRRLVFVMSTFENPHETIIIDDIPINHWINVIIRQDQHRLDIFINGTLTRSAILKSIPNQNYDPVFLSLNGGFQGYISQLQYFAEAIGANKIQSIIDAGPNLRSLGGNIDQTDVNYLSFRWFFPLQYSEMQ
jgi:hypothetical protein